MSNSDIFFKLMKYLKNFHCVKDFLTLGVWHEIGNQSTHIFSMTYKSFKILHCRHKKTDGIQKIPLGISHSRLILTDGSAYSFAI